MRQLFSSLFEDISPRAVQGIIVLLLIVLYLIFDWGGRMIQDQYLQNQTLKGRLQSLVALDTDADLSEEIISVKATLQEYEDLLLNDETIGLNVAGLQSDLIVKLEACGLQQLVVNIDSAPHADDVSWHAYEINVRARDRRNMFPICLSDLSVLDVGLIVSNLQWRRGGNLSFTLRAFSNAEPLLSEESGL